ncbi:hypothetical protein ACH35V_19945 [Actinomadura sp. 1N219]|uniref:terpene synthase family protein n=1 Tax=Actinomadura sp. 1N219 TaxID=3375152 RepID=UPI00379C05CA
MIDLREVELSFPGEALRANPHAAAARRRTREWVRRLGLLNDAQIAEFDSWRMDTACRAGFPDADEDLLQVALDLCWWTFVVDLHIEQGVQDAAGIERLADELASALRDGSNPPGPHPITAGAMDIVQRASRRQTSQWCDSFRHFMLVYLTSRAQDARAQATTVDAYLQRRRQSIGLQMTLDLAQSPTPPSPLLFSAPMLHSRQLLTEHLLLQNDIFSLHRETRSSAGRSIIFCLQRERRCPIEEALTAAIAMADARMSQFTRYQNRIADWIDSHEGSAADRDSCRDALARMLTWTRAVYDWHRQAVRYAP